MNTHPDARTRFAASLALVACIVTLVLLAACGCSDPEAYAALAMLAIMSAFIALTQDA
jgi:major membrane immunogen (membrane-anchored lipoprotein)